MTLKEQYELLRQVFEEGKTLQVYYHQWPDWMDVPPDKPFEYLWKPEREYRIKPQPKRYWIKGHSALSADLPPEKFMKDKGWTLFQEVAE